MYELQIRTLLSQEEMSWAKMRPFMQDPTRGADTLMIMVQNKEVVRTPMGMYRLK